MNIRSFLSRFLTSAVPAAQVTVHHLSGVPQAVSHDMTADRIHGILRASEAGQWDDYLSLVRDITSGDANILADFTQRKTRLLSKPWSCRVSIPDPRAALNEAFCTGQLKQISGLIPALSHLLDSCIWPVSVLEKIYARIYTETDG